MSTVEELKAISELYNDTESLLCQEAKRRIDVFVEYVGKDSKGSRVVQGQIHREIQEHIDECKKRGLPNCGILAPWGHGKTEQAAIYRSLEEIGKDPNIRIQIICNTDDNAAQRVGSISKYIEDDTDYHRIYPHVRKGTSDRDSWGKHRLVVERSSKAKDGTVEAWGITTSGTGSRADLQIFDDPVDLRNAILNPAMRKQVKDSFRNVWMSRLVPGGRRIYIATVWHNDDLTSELCKDPEWNFLIMRVAEDFSCIECESSFKGKFKIDLWQYWNEKLLRSQARQLGQRAFDRGYRQRAISGEDMTFPNYEKIFRTDVAKDFIQPDWVRVIGIDPFGQKVVIFILAISPANKRFVLEIKSGKWDSKRTITEIRQAYLDYMPQIIVCENNASQDAIVQWASELGWGDMPIIPFTTGAQKADPDMGLPSLDVEFANDSWVIPMAGVDQFDETLPVNQLRSELAAHPVAEAADHVMAMWFAREGARYLRREKEEVQIPNTVYQEDVGVEQVQIGDY